MADRTMIHSPVTEWCYLH